jgi:hypothetical protein
VISRRGFLGSAIYAPLYGTGNLNLGIGTYSYHRLSMDAMIAQLQRLEIREIEMSRGEFMLFSKPKPEQFAAARAMFDAAGILCVSYYSATIHDDAELETAIQGARLLGSRNITGDATGGAHRRTLHTGKPDLRNPQPLL